MLHLANGQGILVVGRDFEKRSEVVVGWMAKGCLSLEKSEVGFELHEAILTLKFVGSDEYNGQILHGLHMNSWCKHS